MEGGELGVLIDRPLTAAQAEEEEERKRRRKRKLEEEKVGSGWVGGTFNFTSGVGEMAGILAGF